VTIERAAHIGVGSRHQLAEFVADAPSALVGHASLALDFLRSDAMPSAGHEVHRKEPDRERGAGFVKDGPGTRVGVMAASLAGVGPALAHRVELAALSQTPQ
jgi:hypothetical protein